MIHSRFLLISLLYNVVNRLDITFNAGNNNHLLILPKSQ
jgi:hypothetical protein